MADHPGWGPSGCSSWGSVVGRSNPPYLNGICRYHRNDGTNRSFLFLYQQRTLAWPILLLSHVSDIPPHPSPTPRQSPQQVVGIWDLTTRGHARSQPGMCDSAPARLLGDVTVTATFSIRHAICSRVWTCTFGLCLAFIFTETLMPMTENSLWHSWRCEKIRNSGDQVVVEVSPRMWPFFTNPK